MDMAEVRPKLKQNSIFLQTKDGIFLQSDTATFSLKGRSVYQLLSTLSPHMNGEHTVDELCEGLGTQQRETVLRLIDTLLQRGVLKQCVPEAEGLVEDEVLRYFRPQLELIDHYADRPVERFRAFRQMRVLLVGSGEACITVGISLIRNGIRELSLALLDNVEASLQQLEVEADIVRTSTIEMRLSTVDFDPRSAEAFRQSADYDIVVYCSAMSSFSDVLALQKNCMRKGCLFLPVVFCAGQAVLGPIVESTGPCWLCAQVRLATRMGGEQETAIWKAFVLDGALNTATIYTPIARHIGNAVAFELFKRFAGHLPSELEGGIIYQDGETLESYHERLLRYPLCPLCSHNDPERAVRCLLEVVEGKRDSAPSTADLLRSAERSMHAHTGLLSSYQDEPLVQLPLKVSRLSVFSPARSASSVVAFDCENLLGARVAVLRAAIGRYSDSLPDARTMLLASRHELEQQGKLVFGAQQLARWSGVPPLSEDTRVEWLAAFSSGMQRVCYVPAAAVYPTSYLNQRSVFERSSAGASVHCSFAQMFSAGLASALAYEQMQEIVEGRSMVVKLASETLEDIDSDLTFLLRSLEHFEYRYALFQVLSSSPLPLILAIGTEGEKRLIGIGYGLSSGHAARNALLQLLGKVQMQQYQQQVEKDTFFPEFILPFDVHSPSTRCFQEATVDEGALQASLYRQGRDILFVNTTTADIWDAGTMMSGTVLLTRPA